MVSPILLRRFFLLVFCPFLLLPAVKSDTADDDRTALIDLKLAVGGRTRRWKSDQDHCSWRGVQCDNTGRVTGLRLPGSGLSGIIPLNSIGKLTELRNISLHQNSLSGAIPADLFNLGKLVRLILSGNNFSGEILPEFDTLTELRVLNLENNNLSGSISNLKNLSKLRRFNVSYNQLNGSIPSSLTHFDSSSFLGNSLCGSPLSPCPTGGNGNNSNKLSAGAIIGIVIGSFLGLLFILAVTFILWRKHSGKRTSIRVEMPSSPSPAKLPEFEFQNPTHIISHRNSRSRSRNSSYSGSVNVLQSSGSDGLVFFGDNVDEFSLEELLRASAEVLGKGKFGTTYKAYLEGAIEVVVKRLRNVSVGEREFREKMLAMGALAHENLLPLKGYYYGREEKLIIYDSIPMGSLSALLHGNRGADRDPLTWEIRCKIALGAASGLKYLHSQGFSHGNIKSSNILLTNYYETCVSDYGIAQLVHSISILDPDGYRAPEVTDSRQVSQETDIYSFGVLLLELLTAKSPNNASGNEYGLDLRRWVLSAVQEKRIIGAFDPELLRCQSKDREEEMVQLLNLGIHCTSQHPGRRPSMVEISQLIEGISWVEQ